MVKNTSIHWNNSLRLALSDVDETIADVYTPAEPAMVDELAAFLEEDRKLFLVTGGSLKRIQNDITNFLPAKLRRNILISHCSGAEVWGFTPQGELLSSPFYSIYEEAFNDHMKQAWRKIVDQLINEFGLRPHAAQPKIEFWASVGRDPLDIMLDDRGPQITLEVVNGIDLSDEQLKNLPYPVPLTHGKYDLRVAIMNRANELLSAKGIPITPRLGGIFALDLAIQGVSKATSIKRVLSDNLALDSIGLSQDSIKNHHEVEVWGDKFSVINGGTDRHMSEAVSPKVRSIDFREENPSELPKNFNIVLWDGNYHLHHGLLEYLQSRHEP
jgi:hydroxymethylpyrimidine pyrophosphatase-like HAD family hydrolase